MSLLAKIPYQKPPKNFNEQVDILLSRGILVPDRCKAKFYLSQLNYYRLAAYCLLFELASSATPHLRADLFKNEQRYESGIRNLEKAVNNNQEDFIRHLRTKYAEQLPPIWAIVELSLWRYCSNSTVLM